MLEKLHKYRIILASQSPRRHFLIRQLGLDVTLAGGEVDESYPDGMKDEEVAVYLSQKKADAFKHMISGPETILVTADTIVSIDGKILNKPADRAEARNMLNTLSGTKHEVYTGVTMRNSVKSLSFSSRSVVYFKQLTNEEIEYYIEKYQPFDKAGAYGAQEWIGYIGITRIEGSYFNVMGLPVQRLYEELLVF